MERKPYVSTEYAATLDHLAETLCTARRFGDAALQDTVEFEPVQLYLVPQPPTPPEAA